MAHLFVREDQKELVAQGEELRNGAWLKMSAVARNDLIRRFCRGYVVPPLSAFSPTAFRAQVNDEGSTFSNVSRLLAPPAEYATFGRVNRPHQPVLYLASSPIVAIREVSPAPGAMVSVIALRPRPGTEALTVMPLGTSKLLPPTKWRRGSGPPSVSALSDPDFLDLLHHVGAVEQWKFQDEIIGEILAIDPDPTDRDALYDLTNGIREHVYDTFPSYHGVTYPSVVSFGETPNLALDSVVWDRYLPIEVWVVAAAPHEYLHPDFSTVLYKTPMIARGIVGEGGAITYEKTTDSINAAASELKQRWGTLPKHRNLRPLMAPFQRFRISYGSLPTRLRYDFEKF